MNQYGGYFAALIKKGLKTLEDVPDKLKDAVQKILDGDTD